MRLEASPGGSRLQGLLFVPVDLIPDQTADGSTTHCSGRAATAHYGTRDAPDHSAGCRTFFPTGHAAAGTERDTAPGNC